MSFFTSLRLRLFPSHSFFFFNDTATTEIYTLSLHDALPIWFLIIYVRRHRGVPAAGADFYLQTDDARGNWLPSRRSLPEARCRRVCGRLQERCAAGYRGA